MHRRPNHFSDRSDSCKKRNVLTTFGLPCVSFVVAVSCSRGLQHDVGTDSHCAHVVARSADFFRRFPVHTPPPCATRRLAEGRRRRRCRATGRLAGSRAACGARFGRYLFRRTGSRSTEELFRRVVVWPRVFAGAMLVYAWLCLLAFRRPVVALLTLLALCVYLLHLAGILASFLPKVQQMGLQVASLDKHVEQSGSVIVAFLRWACGSPPGTLEPMSRMEAARLTLLCLPREPVGTEPALLVTLTHEGPGLPTTTASHRFPRGVSQKKVYYSWAACQPLESFGLPFKLWFAEPGDLPGDTPPRWVTPDDPEEPLVAAMPSEEGCVAVPLVKQLEEGVGCAR